MDFRILKQKIFYSQYVRFEPEDHQKIMELVNKLNLPLMKRITDYYGDDIKYEPYEYNDLKKEIDEVLKVSKDENVSNLLNEFKKIIDIAGKDQKLVEVLTD